MSERIEAVKRAVEAFNRRDIDGLLELCDPEIEWSPPSDLPGSRTYHGHDGVREEIGDLTGIFADLQAEPVGFVENGDRVIGFYIWRGHGAGSGIAVDAFEVEVGFICEFKGDLATSMRFFNGFEDAARAAGIEYVPTRSG